MDGFIVFLFLGGGGLLLYAGIIATRSRPPLRFRNPANGYEETVNPSFWYALLLGPYYFMMHGVWTHAVIHLLLSPLSWLVYPFLARKLIIQNYLREGWVLVDGEP